MAEHVERPAARGGSVDDGVRRAEAAAIARADGMAGHAITADVRLAEAG
jgi:hypothetical protein